MNDMDEFLRRAAEHRARARARAANQRPVIQLVEPIEAEIVEAEPVDLAAHVDSHLDSTKFNERSSHFGEGFGQADDRLEARIQAKFKQRLGNIPQGSVAPVDAEVVDLPADAGTMPDLIQMLRSPQHLRQAVVISEILQPRHERW